jgi:hypothetical protein
MVKGREYQRYGVSQERVEKLVAAACELEGSRLYDLSENN